MSKVSKSPERNTFQRDGYIKRCEEKGKPVDPHVVAMYNEWKAEADVWAEQEHKNDLEYDLRTTDWILAKARASESYAQNIYAALCNMQWCKRDLWPVLAEQYWSCSWRHAGGIVADMRQEGDYIDWYCSGSGGLNQDYEGEETNEEWAKRTGFVPESFITEEVEQDFNRLGWIPVPYKDEEI